MAEGKQPTKPDLWSRIKARVKADSKGGSAGQWSAQKANLALIAYRKAGGSWKQTDSGGTRSESSMKQWNDENWATKDGSKRARQSDGTTKRYLPKSKRDSLTKAQLEATDRKKRRAKVQFVNNTKKARVSKGRR